MNDIYLREIYKALIFKGLTKKEILHAIEIFNVQVLSYPKGSLIHRAGEKTEKFGLILYGKAIIESFDVLGNRLIIGHTRRGTYFAESFSILTNEPTYFDVVAEDDSTIAFFDMSNLKENIKFDLPFMKTFLFNLLYITSQKNMLLAKRTLNTSPGSIRERVLLYLNTMSNEKRIKEFDLPYNRQQMADYLNLNRSALSRELSRMQADGLIKFHLNHFKITC